jgi:tRNA G18 (ribose-2'-O)-methylase SpoU
MSFVHLRHKEPLALSRRRELAVAVPQLQSKVNLSRIVRAAGCCGLPWILAEGTGKLDPKIARDGADEVRIDTCRTLGPALKKLKADGYSLVGLEQTTGSIWIHEYAFPRKTLLVLGNERAGIPSETLELLDAAVEIPVYGLPFSHNVATAAAIGMYEYCRQYPTG